MKRLLATTVVAVSFLGAAPLATAQMKGMDMKDMPMKMDKKDAKGTVHNSQK